MGCGSGYIDSFVQSAPSFATDQSMPAFAQELWKRLRPGVRRRTVLLGLLTGTASGAAAFLFFLALEGMSHLCIRVWMNVHLPQPAGEQILGDVAVTGGAVKLLVLLLPGLGAFLGALLVHRFAPEAAGDGMNATIQAFHEKEGEIPPHVAAVKAVASILTIGSGGSSGREGPIAQICGGCGSFFARLLRLGARERRTMMLSGTAAGIGAIFRTPLGGAISAVEILYKEDFESSSLISCVISSVTAYTVFCALLNLPFFPPHPATMYTFPQLATTSGWDPVFFVILGLLCAAVGRVFLWSYNGMREQVFARVPLPMPVRAGLGGLAVGVVALFCTDTLGPGQGLIQAIVDLAPGNAVYGTLAWRYALLLALTILTTSLTIGSGGSGGVFGPTLVIGGLTGAMAGAAFHALLPGMLLPPLAVFVLLGMAGVFAGVANATIGAVVMVCEMTASYSLLPALLVVVALAVLLSPKKSLYRSQVADRFKSPVYRKLMFADVLAELKVKGYFRAGDVPVIRQTATAAELRRFLADERIPFPLTVVDDSGVPCGMLTMGTIRPVYFEDTDHRLFLVRDMATPLVTCTPEDSLIDTLKLFESSGYSRIPVASSKPGPGCRLLGSIQYQDVMHAYQTELERRKQA